MRRYEQVYILRPSLSENEIATAIENTNNIVLGDQGTIIQLDKWGMRKLAYPIKRHLKGHYFVVNYLAPNDLVIEYERKIRIEDRIIRFLTVKLGDAVDVPVRLEQAAEVRRVREEEAAARAAAEAEALAQAEAAKAAMESKQHPQA